MTLAENLADLEGHAARSTRRVDFAYSVIEIDTGDRLGEFPMEIRRNSE